MRTVVIGAGHNGLVCACYLARAGHDVLVLEQAPAPGGGSRTEEVVPGFRFDTHSVAHNILAMTPVPSELDLAGAGLRYVEMDPFAVALHEDGRRVRFHRSVEATVASIAQTDPLAARAYADLMADALPLVEAGTLGLRAGGEARALAGGLLRRLPTLARLARAAPRLGPELLGSYGQLLRSRLPGSLLAGHVAAFAAHASAAPDVPGGALFGFWQAAYHRFGQWHALGGAQALTDALVHRLEASGGAVRCDAPAGRIETSPAGRARGVVLEDGERVAADVVVSAIDPRTALLELLDPPLGGPVADALRAATTANTVQAVLHVAVDRLPAYAGLQPGDHHGLQSFVDDLGALEDGFRAAAAGRLRHPLPAYAFTTSALDPSLAPPGHHTVYLASPGAPYRVDGGWDAAAPAVVEDLLEQVEARAPGFRDTVVGLHLRTPEAMARELRWTGAHPMYLDLAPAQLGPLRPVPALAGHRTPVDGLYVSGAGTAPVGGISGAPGRAAARAVLRDLAGGAAR